MSEAHETSNKHHEKQPYYDIDTLLGMIEGGNGEACRQMHEDFRDKFLASPGSRHNHQYWPGGYIDHVTDAMNVGLTVYETYNDRRPLPFSASDVLMIVYLHDLEKPFVYTYNEDGSVDKNPELLEKSAREAFKRNLIDEYGFEFTPMQDNALEFVEGIRDSKYSNTSRVMGELAVLCHIADLTSARLWYNHPLAENDSWIGSKRQNPAAADVTLASEFTD
jgi:hypothetical protein